MPISAQRGGSTRGPYANLPRNQGLLAQVLRFGARQIGVPYTWGGTTRAGGFDCSGLIYAAYRRAGYGGIGRTTYDQVKQGVGVARQDLQPGDIIFPEPGHEGMYVGNGMVLSAPHTGAKVHVTPLSQFGFWQARRLIRGGGGIVPPPALGGVSRTGLPIPHPSVNAAAYAADTRNAGVQWKHLMQQQTKMFANSQATLLKSLQSQAAQTRQQNLGQALTLQNQQKAQGAQIAQQQVSGAGSLTASGVPAEGQFQTKKGILDQVHLEALKRAGIG